MSETQLITTRSGVLQFPSISQFPSVGYKNFLYIDRGMGYCYQWDNTISQYTRIYTNIRTWSRSTQYYTDDIVLANNALLVCTTDHVSSSSGTIFDEQGKWRNSAGHGRADVTTVSGSPTITISEFNCSDFNIFVQPDSTTTSLLIVLPDPALRAGQVLTYCFSAMQTVADTAVVTFEDHLGDPYPYTPAFKIPQSSFDHQGIRTIRFVSTSSGNGDITAMWFPLDEDFRGATDTLPGSNGYVPAPAITDRRKFLKATGSWDTVLPILRNWTASTQFYQGELFLVEHSMFIATSDVTTGTSFTADLTAANPYVWIGGDEYVYDLPTTPSTISINVPTFNIVQGTSSGSFILPSPTGSGRKIRFVREDDTTTNITITDPVSLINYPIPHTNLRGTGLVLVDNSPTGWSVEMWPSAPKIFGDTVFTSNATLDNSHKNVIQRIDTSVSAIEITLPTTNMNIGDNYQLIDLRGSWGTHPVTVTSKIYGANDSYVIDLPKRKVTFVYVDSATGYIME